MAMNRHEDLWRQAAAREAAGDLDGALRLARVLTAEGPGDGAAWRARGLMAIRLRAPRVAVACLKRAALLTGDGACVARCADLAWDSGARGEALALARRACVLNPAGAGAWRMRGMAGDDGGATDESLAAMGRSLCLDPTQTDLWLFLTGRAWAADRFDLAEAALDRWQARMPAPALPARSAVIAVLDDSPHSRWNIHTLLDDLRDFDGEVVVVFNGPRMVPALVDHPRIDRHAVNSANAGVARAWNIGMNLAEGAVVFILNADLHIGPGALAPLEEALHALDDAVIVGVEGQQVSHDLRTERVLTQAEITAPTPLDLVHGYCMAVHADRFHDAGMAFDPRLAPCFYEELDIGLQARARGLAVYGVPAPGIDHEWGVSRSGRPVDLFGRTIPRNAVLVRHHRMLRRKWNRG